MNENSSGHGPLCMKRTTFYGTNSTFEGLASLYIKTHITVMLDNKSLELTILYRSIADIRKSRSHMFSQQ